MVKAGLRQNGLVEAGTLEILAPCFLGQALCHVPRPFMRLEIMISLYLSVICSALHSLPTTLGLI